jgi:uncharacterized protein YecE (DUF72 family)
MQLYIGCSGWSYSAWLGHFYPAKLGSNRYLTYYSKVFDYVEIDSSFYRIPTPIMTSRWAKNTPDSFKFTAKMPQAVTHEKRLGQGSDDILHYFFESMALLKDKLGCILIQLPPSMKKNEGFKKLKNLALDNRFRYAIEIRNKSWFDIDVFDFLAESKICLTWSQLTDFKTMPLITTDFLYMRLIGDRSIPESAFGHIQIDRMKEMLNWADLFNKANDYKNLKRGFVAANNHYAGFGPGSANMFRTMLGMKPVVFEEMKQATLD